MPPLASFASIIFPCEWPRGWPATVLHATILPRLMPRAFLLVVRLELRFHAVMFYRHLQISLCLKPDTPQHRTCPFLAFALFFYFYFIFILLHLFIYHWINSPLYFIPFSPGRGNWIMYGEDTETRSGLGRLSDT